MRFFFNIIDAFVPFCKWFYFLFWDSNTVMTGVSIFRLLFIMSVLFTYRWKYNGIWCKCHSSKWLSAIKPGSIHHFLHLKMPVPSQEYNSCCQIVEFYTTVIKVRGLASHKFRFTPPFSAEEHVCTKSGI